MGKLTITKTQFDSMTTISATNVWRNSQKNFHREDGPAIIWHEQLGLDPVWCLNGIIYSFEQWLDEVEKQHGGEYAMKMKLKWAAQT